MRKRTKVLLVVGCLGAVIAAVILLSRNSEPRYQGRSLSQWLLSSESIRYPEGIDVPPEGVEAIRHIGTNAIPTLLHWVSYEPSAVRRALQPLLQQLPPHLKKHLLYGPEYRAIGAENAIAILGPEARSAIPALTRLALTSTKEARFQRCARALISIGPEAIPALAEVFTNTQSQQRFYLVGWIATLGTNALPAVPILIKALDDKDENVAGISAAVLGDLALAPAVSIPALTNALQSTNHRLRAHAVAGLAGFKIAAKPAVPRLIQLLQDPDPLVRENITNALRQIAPEALTNAPAQ